MIALASALAARSLRDSVLAVLQALPDLPSARDRLSWIVGRDVSQLDQDDILRASAETASENAVDGLFAPLFWMLIGAALWKAGFSQGPGPLALAWAFKASSTLDSMLGYKQGRLRWLGTAGARLDDLLTWLPCRMVLITLPLVSMSWTKWPTTVRAAASDGRPDPSPNAGLSESIFAHCADVQMGGLNRYRSTWINKPLLSAQSCKATASGGAQAVEPWPQAGSRLAGSGSWVLFRSVSTSIHGQQKHSKRAHDDRQIQKERTTSRISQIKPHPLGIAEIVATTHLPQPG